MDNFRPTHQLNLENSISALCFVDCLQNLLQSLLFLSGSRHHVYFTYNLIKNVNKGGKLFFIHKSSLNLFGTLFFKMTHSFMFYPWRQLIWIVIRLSSHPKVRVFCPETGLIFPQVKFSYSQLFWISFEGIVLFVRNPSKRSHGRSTM